MRTRYDQLGKQMVRTALETYRASFAAAGEAVILNILKNGPRKSRPKNLGGLGQVAPRGRATVGASS